MLWCLDLRSQSRSILINFCSYLWHACFIVWQPKMFVQLIHCSFWQNKMLLSMYNAWSLFICSCYSYLRNKPTFLQLEIGHDDEDIEVILSISGEYEVRSFYLQLSNAIFFLSLTNKLLMIGKAKIFSIITYVAFRENNTYILWKI